MHTITTRLLNFLTLKPKNAVDRLSRSCSSSTELVLLFQQTSSEVNVGLPRSNISNLTRSKTLTDMDMITKDHQQQGLPLPRVIIDNGMAALDCNEQKRQMHPRRSSTSYVDLCELISEMSVNEAIDHTPKAETAWTTDVVDDDYWGMPSEPSFHNGMTVARKEAKDRALQNLQKRINQSKQGVAESFLSLETDVADHSDSTAVPYGDNDDYWVWQTPEQPQDAPLSIPPPQHAEEYSHIIKSIYESHSYWDFPYNSPYGGMAVARKEERESALRHVQERISHFHAQHWHWNYSVVHVHHMHA